MDIGSPLTPDEQAQSEKHYVQDVAVTGESREIVAHEDIYSASGIKLVSAGTRINRGMLGTLVKHKLKKSLDYSVGAEDGVTPNALHESAAVLIADDPLFRHLASCLPDTLAFRHTLARIPLPGPLATRLTVMHEARPLLFTHSLRTALIAMALGILDGLDDEQLAHLAVAALLHDVGEMHTDPALLDPAHRISDTERRFIYAHPITGFLIVKEFPEFPQSVALAILQHHERLDGSGYPGGISGAQISPWGQIVAMSDVLESLSRKTSHSGQLSTILRLNQKKFSRRHIDYLATLLTRGNLSGGPAVATPPQEQVLPWIAAIFKKWDDARNASPGNEQLFSLFNERMRNLRFVLLQLGFDPDNLDLLARMAREDKTVGEELESLGREFAWQAHDLLREIDRHPDWIGHLENPENTSLKALILELREFTKCFS